MERVLSTVAESRFQTASSESPKPGIPYLAIKCKMNYSINDEEDYRQDVSFMSDGACESDEELDLEGCTKEEAEIKIEDDALDISFSTDKAYEDLERNEDTDDASEVGRANEDEDFEEVNDSSPQIQFMDAKKECKVDDDVQTTISPSKKDKANYDSRLHEALDSIMNSTSDYFNKKSTGQICREGVSSYMPGNNHQHALHLITANLRKSSDNCKDKKSSSQIYRESVSCVPGIEHKSGAVTRNYLGNNFSDKRATKGANQNSNGYAMDFDEYASDTKVDYKTKYYEPTKAKVKAEKIDSRLSGRCGENCTRKYAAMKRKENGKYSQTNDVASSVESAKSVSSAKDEYSRRTREWVIKLEEKYAAVKSEKNNVSETDDSEDDAASSVQSAKSVSSAEDENSRRTREWVIKQEEKYAAVKSEKNNVSETDDSEDDATSSVESAKSVSSAEDEDIQRIREWVVRHDVSKEQTDSLLQILRQRILPSAPVSGEELISSSCPTKPAYGAYPEEMIHGDYLVIEEDRKSEYEKYDVEEIAKTFKMENNVVNTPMSYIKFTTKYGFKLPIDTVEKFELFDTKIKTDHEFYTDLSALIVSRLSEFDDLRQFLVPVFKLILAKNVMAHFLLKKRTVYQTKMAFFRTALSDCLYKAVKEYVRFISKDINEVDYVNAVLLILRKSCKFDKKKVRRDEPQKIRSAYYH